MREAFAALVALVGFLSGVQARVLNEMVFVFEGLLTDLTLVRTFACRDKTTGERGSQDGHETADHVQHQEDKAEFKFLVDFFRQYGETDSTA